MSIYEHTNKYKINFIELVQDCLQHTQYSFYDVGLQIQTTVTLINLQNLQLKISAKSCIDLIASQCWLLTVVFLCFLCIYFDYNNLRVLNTFTTLIMIVVSAQSYHDIIAQCVVYNKQGLNSLNRNGVSYRKI